MEVLIVFPILIFVVLYPFIVTGVHIKKFVCGDEGSYGWRQYCSAKSQVGEIIAWGFGLGFYSLLLHIESGYETGMIAVPLYMGGILFTVLRLFCTVFHPQVAAFLWSLTLLFTLSGLGLMIVFAWRGGESAFASVLQCLVFFNALLLHTCFIQQYSAHHISKEGIDPEDPEQRVFSQLCIQKLPLAFAVVVPTIVLLLHNLLDSRGYLSRW